MEKNVCGLDRLVRLTVGPTLLLFAYKRSRSGDRNQQDGAVSLWQIAAGYAGAELLVTGLFQWCPGNYLLGIDTCDEA